jgi:drug/metabolite transporter (DMT)-like permease
LTTQPLAAGQPATSPSKRNAYLAWIVVCLVWGTTYLAIRIALETVPPLLMAGFRWTTAGALIVIVLAARGERLPARPTWPALALLGVLLIGFGNGAVVWAEQTVPSGLTAVLVAAVPFWMVGIDRFMAAPEPLTTRRVGGLLVGFAGIVLLVWPELRDAPGSAFLTGVLATQLACVGWALGSTLSRRREHTENVLATAALQMLFGGICMLIAGSALQEWKTLSFTGRTTGAVIYLVLVGSVAGFSAYAYALKHLPVATVSLYAYVNPVIAVVLGTLLLGEPLNPRLAAAGAIVLVGIAMVRGR